MKNIAIVGNSHEYYDTLLNIFKDSNLVDEERSHILINISSSNDNKHNKLKEVQAIETKQILDKDFGMLHKIDDVRLHESARIWFDNKKQR